MKRWETISEIVIDVCVSKQTTENRIMSHYGHSSIRLIHMDFLTIESGKMDKDVSILIIMDHFTWYVQAFITPLQTAWVVAQTLWGKFFMHYWISWKNFSIKGYNLESKLIADLCKLPKTKKLQTMPYWPQYNGQCEHFNLTLISMIRTLPIEAKIKWQEQLPTLVHAYNCSHSNATGFSPFYLMYGRQLMLPIDVQFGVRTPDIVASTSPGHI